MWFLENLRGFEMKKDPRIAEMGKAIIQALDSPEKFNEEAFNVVFAEEASARHIPQRSYFYNLRRWVKSDVTIRIGRYAKRLAEKAKQFEPKRRQIRKIPAGSKITRQLSLF